MRPFLLILVALVLNPPTGAAEDPDPDPPYHVKPEVGTFEAPEDRGDEYDCAGDGPHGIADTVFYDVDETIEPEGRSPEWMGIPYVGPECLAVDVRTQDPLVPTRSRATDDLVEVLADCDVPVVEKVRRGVRTDRLVELPPVPVLEAAMRATFNVSSGQYYILVDVPANPFFVEVQDDEDVEVSGNTGAAVKFDCRECEPPW